MSEVTINNKSSIEILKNNNNNNISNSSKSSLPCKNKNNSSINLLNRNLLSVNNSKFENLKKVKSQTTIYQMDKNESNYLDPLSSYSFIKNEAKELQKRNNINNLEWLSIIKHKLFSIDVNSKVKKGRNISRNDFYEEKNKIIISSDKISDINNNSKNNINNIDENKIMNSYQFINKNIKRDNNGQDYKFNSTASMDNIFKNEY